MINLFQPLFHSRCLCFPVKFSSHQNHLKRDAGFTLVEVIVVIAIVSIMLPVIFSIITTVARQQSKIYRISEAKQQGDFALAFMKNYIRNTGDRIYQLHNNQTNEFAVEVCNTLAPPGNTHITQTGKDFYIKKNNTPNQYFRFYNERSRIDLDGASGNREREISQIFFDDNGSVQQLTTNNVKIENFSLQCIRRTESGKPYIVISFLIYFTGNSDTFDLSNAKSEDIAILDYRTVVQMR